MEPDLKWPSVEKIESVPQGVAILIGVPAHTYFQSRSCFFPSLLYLVLPISVPGLHAMLSFSAYHMLAVCSLYPLEIVPNSFTCKCP